MTSLDWFRIAPPALNMALLCLAAALLLRARGDRAAATRSRLRAQAPRAALILSAASLAWLAATALAYLAYPSYYDHAEPTVAAIAANWKNGHAMFTPVDAPERYSILYGPWPFLTNAWAQSAGAWAQSAGLDVIAASKLPGVLNLMLALAALALAARALIPTRTARWSALGLFAAALLGHANASYWNRPDSFLLAYVNLGLLLATAAPAAWLPATFGALGLLAGASIDSKLHAGAYFAPLFVLAWELARKKPDSRARGLGFCALSLATAAIGGALGLALPFALARENWITYVEWVQLSRHVGLSPRIFAENITYAAAFAAALWTLGARRQTPWTFATLIACGFAVAAVASKPGSGPHHILPFVGPVALLAANALAGVNLTGLAPRRGRIAFAALWIALAYGAWVSQGPIVRMHLGSGERQAERQEFERVLRDCPGPSAMGTAMRGEAPATFLRPLLIARGDALFVDSASLMEMLGAHVAIPDATLAALSAGAISCWIFPTDGRPWSAGSFYGGALYPDAWRIAFERAYGPDQTPNQTHDRYAVYRPLSH